MPRDWLNESQESVRLMRWDAYRLRILVGQVERMASMAAANIAGELLDLANGLADQAGRLNATISPKLHTDRAAAGKE